MTDEINGAPIDPNNPPVPGAKPIPIVPVNGINQVTVSDDKTMADIFLFGPTGTFVMRVPTKAMRKLMQAFASATQAMVTAGCDVGYPQRQTVLHKKPGKLIIPG